MVSPARLATLKAHIAAEAAGDIDAIMATLGAHPRYVIPDYLCEGRAALKAMYEWARPSLNPANSAEYLRALDDPAVCLMADDHIVLEYTDAYPLHAGMVVVVRFEGDLIASENTYFTHRTRFHPAGDDAQFLAVPGVSRLA